MTGQLEVSKLKVDSPFSGQCSAAFDAVAPKGFSATQVCMLKVKEQVEAGTPQYAANLRLTVLAITRSNLEASI